jgi:hypothetical protein
MRVSSVHVVDAAAAVVDVRQHQQRDVVGEVQREVGRVDEAQLQARGDGDALGDVEVGREIAALRRGGRGGAAHRPSAGRRRRAVP